MKKFLKHLLAITIILIPLFLMFFLESWIFPRALVTIFSSWDKIKDIFYFYVGKDYEPTYMLENIWFIPGSIHIIPEIDFNKFGAFMADYWKILWSQPNFMMWGLKTSETLMNFARFLMIFVIVMLMLYLIFQGYFDENKFDFTKKSKPLIGYLRFKNGPWAAFKQKVKNYFKWFYNSYYFITFITILAFNLCAPFIVIELFVEYFHFFACFNFVSLLDTVAAEIITLYQVIAFLPTWIKLLLLFILIRLLTILHAKRLIEGKLIPRDEAMVNNDTGVFTLILGKMRGGKTTLATSMARIMNTIYHKNAYENMNRVSLMFPEFPFIALEKEIARLTLRHRIVNVQQAGKYVLKIYRVSLNKPFVLFGYDITSMKTEFYDGACNISLEDALIIYAESYWVYFHPGNLIASNYPIRTDDLRLDKGHLVLWDYDYFRRKNKKSLWEYSKLSHILVFDSLRMGKKKTSNNIYKDTAGPMVAVSTEFGKEYGNMVTNQAYSAKDEEANPKNDLLDYSLKLGGHLANIWHTNFFKFIGDEQRSGSLSANLVDVAQSIFTADKKNQKEKSALHLFLLEPLILDFFIKIRDNFYSKYRYVRDDNTLMFYLLNKLGTWAYSIESYVYMRYGYKEVILPRCTCDSTGNLKEEETEKFYIINFIDYANRFESACMKDFLNQYKNDAYRGFFDLPEYKKLMPNKKEWEMQGSYLVSDLIDPTRKFGATTSSKSLNGSRRTRVADRSNLKKGGLNSK